MSVSPVERLSRRSSTSRCALLTYSSEWQRPSSSTPAARGGTGVSASSPKPRTAASQRAICSGCPVPGSCSFAIGSARNAVPTFMPTRSCRHCFPQFRNFLSARFRAVETETPRIAQIFANKDFRARNRVPQRLVGLDDRHPYDRTRFSVESPQPDQTAAIEDRMIRKIDHRFLALQTNAFPIFRRDQTLQFAAKLVDSVEAAHDGILRMFRRLEFLKRIAILRQDQPVILQRFKAQRFHRGFRRLAAQAGKPLEFRERCSASPAEIALRQFQQGLLQGKLSLRERIGLPKGVFITLPIQAPIYGNSANLALGLHGTERNRQRRRNTLPHAFRAQTAGGSPDCHANGFSIQWTACQCLQNCGSKPACFFVGYAEFCRYAVLVFSERLPCLQPNGVIRRWQNIRASPRRGQFLDRGFGDRVVDRGTAETRAAEQRQIWRRATDGPCPSGSGQNFRRGLARQGTVEPLPVRPP